MLCLSLRCCFPCWYLVCIKHTSVMSASNHIQCACGDASCDHIALELNKLLPNIYSNKKIRIKKLKKDDEMSESRLHSYRNCIKSYFNLDSKYYNNRDICIAQHHWKPDVLSFIQQNLRTKTISKSVAEQLGIASEANQFISNSNRDKDVKYHLPPTNSINDAKHLIKMLKAAKADARNMT